MAARIRPVRGCRIMAITAGFQPADRGSIPLTRSKEKTTSRVVFSFSLSGMGILHPLAMMRCMKLYIGHGRDFDYQNELYTPLRTSELASFVDIILPHEDGGKPFHSKTDLQGVDVMLAEISHPSTGLGIELGYADLYQIPIIIAYKAGSQPSSTAKVLGTHAIEYTGPEDLVRQLIPILKDGQWQKKAAP